MLDLEPIKLKIVKIFLFSYFRRKRVFRPVQKVISMDEYEAQGRTETEKALRELRSFCNTPQSDPWKLQLSLRDPQRYLEFATYFVIISLVWAYNILHQKFI